MGEERTGTGTRMRNWSLVNWGGEREERPHFILGEQGKHVIRLDSKQEGNDPLETLAESERR